MHALLGTSIKMCLGLEIKMVAQTGDKQREERKGIDCNLSSYCTAVNSTYITGD